MSRIAHSRRRADWTYPPIEYSTTPYDPNAPSGLAAWLPDPNDEKYQQYANELNARLRPALDAAWNAMMSGDIVAMRDTKRDLLTAFEDVTA